MRIVRCVGSGGSTVFGELTETGVAVVAGSFDHGFVPTGEVLGLDQVRLLAPAVPRTVVCVGRNYAEHAHELGNEVPTEPLVFLKPASAIIGPGEEIVLPAASNAVEHEAELAVVISHTAHRLTRDQVADHVFGVVLANDVTARDVQRSDPQWTRGKGFRTSLPVGPWIETDVDLTSQDVGCSVNGEVRQHGSSREWIFDLADVLTYVTAFLELEPGDLILTGTPAGVGPLRPGDTLRTFGTGLGTLDNPVRAERAR